MTEHRYTIGDLADIAKVSAKAIRIYEEKGLLTSNRDETNNYRCFDEASKLQLQRIQMLQYLGFSLQSIGRTLKHYNQIDLENSFLEQKKLLEDKAAELQRMIHCVERASIECKQADFNIDTLFDAIHRIIIDRAADEGVWRLQKHSNEPEGWSRWIFDQASLRDGQTVLDAGSGWGNLWRYNLERLPAQFAVRCVDKHNTHADAFCAFAQDMPPFSFTWANLETMALDETYDRIFFNHVVLFIADPVTLYRKFSKALKRDGQLICTWGGSLLFENLTDLLAAFKPARADKIRKSMAQRLERFRAREAELAAVFPAVEKRRYEISLHYDSIPDLAEFLKVYAEKLDCDLTCCTEDFCTYLTERYQGNPLEFTRDSYLFICKNA